MTMKSFTAAALTTSALSMAFAGSASAITFNIDQLQNAAERSGSLSYDGQGGSLNGNNISFSYINTDGGRNFTCSDRCMLNFSTGDNITEENGDYAFAGGGSFTLTGTLTDDEGNNAFVPGTGSDAPLLSGMFQGTQDSANRIGSESFSFVGNGSTSVSEDFLSYLGIDPTTDFMFINTQFSLRQTTFTDDGGFNGDISNADLTVNDVDVPEPSELAMFGMGLLLVGGGLFARRRLG